jgi:hypothetical protein
MTENVTLFVILTFKFPKESGSTPPVPPILPTTCWYIQGGAVNHGLKRFYSLYRPSCLIEAYVRSEKYWLVWAGPLANHPFNFNFMILSDGLTAAAERAACVAYIYRH